MRLPWHRLRAGADRQEIDQVDHEAAPEAGAGLLGGGHDLPVRLGGPDQLAVRVERHGIAVLRQCALVHRPGEVGRQLRALDTTRLKRQALRNRVGIKVTSAPERFEAQETTLFGPGYRQALLNLGRNMAASPDLWRIDIAPEPVAD